MSSFNISKYDFNEQGREQLLSKKKSRDWPVVYLIHNDKQLYVGETQNIYNRFDQHLKNEERKKLKSIKIVFDDEFNKSAVLDIEQQLIQLFNADNKYELQNLNGGQSEKHNYYQREKYINKIDEIWESLTKLGMTKLSIDEIRNSDLFKYSPYNTLTSEQQGVCSNVIKDMLYCLKNNISGTSIISGKAGTGKTIVLINLIYKLVNAKRFNIDPSREEDSLTDNAQLIHDIQDFYNEVGEIEIGYVVPMTSIRKTIKTVFANTKNGLTGKMVIGPFDVFKKDYDVIIVDESHRLARYKNIGFRGEFSKNALKLNKNPKDVTQLDMIVAKSKYRILVYDQNQTVKGSDITHDDFMRAICDTKISKFNLTTQMRCKGGEDYIDYLDSIFNVSCQSLEEIEDYDFKLFDDVDNMINAIKELDKKYGLCRNAAGYSWEWISKNKGSYEKILELGLQDITIGNYKYVWNMTNSEFILNKNSINEIGCIHTMQGYDLNYIGVILGYEIDYNPKTNKIEIDLNKFYDKYVKQGCCYDDVYNYIINSYKVIMARGIKGCYVYACNKNMREYLSRFIEKKGE